MSRCTKIGTGLIVWLPVLIVAIVILNYTLPSGLTRTLVPGEVPLSWRILGITTVVLQISAAPFVVGVILLAVAFVQKRRSQRADS